MRIQSKWKEAYDFQGTFDKDDILYKREISEIEFSITPGRKDWSNFIIEKLKRVVKIYPDKDDYQSLGILFIANAYYPVVKRNFQIEYMFKANKELENFQELIKLLPEFEIEYSVPVWLLTSGHIKDRKEYGLRLTLNPKLKENGFDLDPFQTYQEIDMYLSNIAFPHTVNPQNTSEKYRMKSRFGYKYAFRKEPENKNV